MAESITVVHCLHIIIMVAWFLDVNSCQCLWGFTFCTDSMFWEVHILITQVSEKTGYFFLYILSIINEERVESFVEILSVNIAYPSFAQNESKRLWITTLSHSSYSFSERCKSCLWKVCICSIYYAWSVLLLRPKPFSHLHCRNIILSLRQETLSKLISTPNLRLPRRSASVCHVGEPKPSARCDEGVPSTLAVRLQSQTQTDRKGGRFRGAVGL